MSEDALVPEILSGEALAAVTKGEVDIQISTAKAYPRDITKVRKNILATACLDQQTAEECYYLLPRAGQDIDGPSVRLAEIVAAAYTNLTVGTRVIGIDARHVTCQGVAWDLENNVRTSTEVVRSIVDKRGKRYPDHLILTTVAACSAIARRNAIFQTVPKALLKSVEPDIRKMALGDERTLPVRREAAINWFADRGGEVEDICRTLGVESVEEIGLTELQRLTMIRNAVLDGSTTVQEAFALKRKAESVGEILKDGKHDMTGKAPEEKPAEEQGPNDEKEMLDATRKEVMKRLNAIADPEKRGSALFSEGFKEDGSDVMECDDVGRLNKLIVVAAKIASEVEGGKKKGGKKKGK